MLAGDISDLSPDETANVEDFIAHHGVKGMHWGVRKARDSSGSSGSSDNGYASALMKTPRSKAAAIASLKSSEEKSLAKAEPSEADGEKKSLTPAQKRNLKIAAGAAVAGAIVAYGVYKAKTDPEFLDHIASLAGKKIEPEEFNKAVDFSKAYSWGEFGYVRPSSFDREEFSIPAGNVYHRISSVSEHSFRDVTYATANEDDFHRYVVHFGGAGSEPHHVSWNSKSEVKVPRLSTVLSTMHETMTEEYAAASPKARKVLNEQASGGHYLSKENVLRTYEGQSGGQWSDPQAKTFISKLKAKGYDAIVDEMDAGVTNDKPLVIFSPEKMGPKSSAPIDEVLRNAARINLKELESRKIAGSVTHSDTMKDPTPMEMSVLAGDISDLSPDETANVEDFIAHHGVKGMHWGVRKERDSSGDSGGSGGSYSIKAFGARVESLTDKDKAVLKSAGMSPSQAPSMEAKYGPGSSETSKKGLSKGQKELIAGGIVAAAVVGLSIYGAKNADNATIQRLVKNGLSESTAKYLVVSDKEKNAHAGLGLTAEKLAKLGSEDLSFEPGHIFSRVSTELEKEIRQEGFYASHSKEDLERYKAVLPVYWKLWPSTASKTSGYVNHYASSGKLRVASEKTLYDTMKKSLDDVIKVNGRETTVRKHLTTYVARGVSSASSDERVLQKSYYQVVGNFTDPKDPVVSHLTKLLTSAGYHGIVDANDAGSLAAQPVKFLSSAGFSIVGHEDLSESAISAAQSAIAALAHILYMLSKGSFMEVDEFLAHHGVKGQKWGVHHARSQARSDANEFAKARAYYGEGAGTRRKLIKAKVETRMKNPHYADEFKKTLANQNLEKRQAQATRLRRRTNVRKSTVRTAKGVHRQLTGGFGPVTASAAAIAAGVAYAHSTGLDKAVLSKVKSVASDKIAQEAVRAWLKSQGIG